MRGPLPPPQLTDNVLSSLVSSPPSLERSKSQNPRPARPYRIAYALQARRATQPAATPSTPDRAAHPTRRRHSRASESRYWWPSEGHTDTQSTVFTLTHTPRRTLTVTIRDLLLHPYPTKCCVCGVCASGNARPSPSYCVDGRGAAVHVECHSTHLEVRTVTVLEVQCRPVEETRCRSRSGGFYRSTRDPRLPCPPHGGPYASPTEDPTGWRRLPLCRDPASHCMLPAPLSVAIPQSLRTVFSINSVVSPASSYCSFWEPASIYLSGRTIGRTLRAPSSKRPERAR